MKCKFCKSCMCVCLFSHTKLTFIRVCIKQKVYLGLDTSKGSLLAVKKLSLSNGQMDEEDSSHLKELEQEVSLMRSLSHVNVVRYLGAELHIDGGMK
jgi:serine/threonine protein kinase